MLISIGAASRRRSLNSCLANVPGSVLFFFVFSGTLPSNPNETKTTIRSNDKAFVLCFNDEVFFCFDEERKKNGYHYSDIE